MRGGGFVLAGGDGAGPRRNGGAALGCCCISTVVFAIFGCLSLASLQPTEFGLRYNRFTKQIDQDHVYYGGRHLIGPFSSILPFPATVQNLEFSTRYGAMAPPLSTRTGDGLALDLQVAFQYQLLKDELGPLYTLANIFYESLFAKVARDILLKTAGRYNASQYWTKRSVVGQDMLAQLNESLTLSHAHCTGLQIMVIDLPETYENAIVLTEVANQIAKTNYYEQQATLTRAKMHVMMANYTRNVTVTIAGANADATYVTKAAEANASKLKIDYEYIAFQHVAKQLPGISKEGLVQYQRQYALMTIPNATFLFGIPNAVAVLGNQDQDSSSPYSSTSSNNFMLELE